MTNQTLEKMNYRQTFVFGELTIAASQSLSSLFDCGGMQLRALLFPSNWTSCNITFKPQVTASGDVYTLSEIDGTAFSLPTVASQWLPLVAYMVDPLTFFKIQCSGNQSAAVTVGVALQPIYQGIHS